MTTGPLPVPSKCKSGRFNAWGHSSTHRTTLWGWWAEGHIMPPHIFEVGLKVNTKVYLDVLKSVLIPWCNQVAGGRPWVWQQDSAPAHKFKETQAWFQKERYDFVLFSRWPPPPPTWTRWTTSFGHTSRTTPTWPPTTPKPSRSLSSVEYSPSSRWRLWKRHAPSSGSVSTTALSSHRMQFGRSAWSDGWQGRIEWERKREREREREREWVRVIRASSVI